MVDIFFFFNDTATTEIYTLSLHDALPISPPLDGMLVQSGCRELRRRSQPAQRELLEVADVAWAQPQRLRGLRRRSEEHTSELQSRQYLVCRLLLEKKQTTYTPHSSFSSCS